MRAVGVPDDLDRLAWWRSPDGSPLDIDALVEAGVHDPDAPDADDRLAVLQYLWDQGASVPQLIAGCRSGSLAGLAADLVTFPRRVLRVDEVADALGWPTEKVTRIYLAAGLPAFEDDLLVSHDVLEVLRLFDAAAQLFGEDAIVQFTRVLGSCVLRIVEASQSLFLEAIDEIVPEDEPVRMLEVARANAASAELLLTIPDVIRRLLPDHIEATVLSQRQVGTRPQSGQDLRTLTVAFVDLVGFTSLSSHLAPDELKEALNRFEAVAWELVVARDGRVVKTIGDEIMFVTASPATGCDLAQQLCAAIDADPVLPAARAGVAHGEVAAWGGDLFGPVVNLASRLAELGQPGEVTVSAAVVDALADRPDWHFRSAGSRPLKGFDAPVPIHTAVRVSDGDGP